MVPDLTPDEKWAERLMTLGSGAGLWEKLETAFAAAPGNTESPIERAFLAAVYVEADYPEVRRGATGAILIHTPLPGGVEIEVQKPLGRYFADFLIAGTDGGRRRTLVVECDGHEFHEKTREQVSHDKRRDREIQKLGHAVFRFSGADIWKDPFGCAREAVDYVSEAP
jgi:very-short-patch-repair endonuclease